MTVKKPHCNGQWSPARLRSFIISALRGASRRWGPKALCIKNARVKRGYYRCEHCKQVGPATLPPLAGNKRRRKNIIADHIHPIVDPVIGFVDYNSWIDRCFVELIGYQALCWTCDQAKQKVERAIRKENKK